MSPGDSGLRGLADSVDCKKVLSETRMGNARRCPGSGPAAGGPGRGGVAAEIVAPVC
jgi:hypothetical protein